MTIGERIKFLRKKNAMTQTDIAKKLNIATQTVFKYEKNIVTSIPMENIQKLSEIFGVTPAYIMGWEDNYSEETIKKEDAVSDIFIRLRNDDKFYEAAQKLYNLNDKQLDAVIAMLSSFEQD